MNTHEVITYTPTTLVPANGLHAVWCDESGDHDLIMWTSPLDFVALADAEYKQYARPMVSLEPVSVHVERGVLVGIDIIDGVAEVVNDREDFCGFCRPGEDLTQFSVPAKYQSRRRSVA